MAYEKNRERLLQIVKTHEYGMNRKDAESFGTKTEEERIKILKRVFNEDISKFETIPLWENDVPGYNGAYELQNRPQIAFFPGTGEKGRSVVLVAPGGGYNCKVSEAEGYPVIHKLVQAGLSAALLDYRVKPYTQYCSVMDIQRAIRLLRFKSKELNIRPDKIAVTGASAGGHLCTMAAVHFDYGNPSSDDPVERASSRPDAAIISYGVFSQVAFPRTGAFVKNFEGEESPKSEGGLVSPYSDQHRADGVYFSPEQNVTTETPPIFMWQTCNQDDPRQMFNFAKELADCGVRFEAHIFPFGPHGMGLADGSGLSPRDDHVMHWSDLALEWLDGYGF